MKMRMFKHIVLVPGLFVVVFFCVNMGEGGQQKKYSSGTGEPAFAALEEGAGNYSGSIFDETTETKLSEVSFFGSTNVGGLRQEDNDSTSSFDMARIHTIEVVEPNFQSKRFNQTFVRVKVTLRSKKNPDKLKTVEVLVPHRVTVCGVEDETGMHKAWFLEKINKIVVHERVGQAAAPQTEQPGRRRKRVVMASERGKEEQSAQVKKKR
ncbi:hypothetical protein K2X40_04355 [Candidatus Babeliales bacterium]|nr:hypothetical protein [Candidatus Babeliales bacterium]